MGGKLDTFGTRVARLTFWFAVWGLIINVVIGNTREAMFFSFMMGLSWGSWMLYKIVQGLREQVEEAKPTPEKEVEEVEKIEPMPKKEVEETKPVKPLPEKHCPPHNWQRDKEEKRLRCGWCWKHPGEL